MKLYGYWRSSSSWRVRIALGLKGVAFDNVPVALLKAEHTADAHRAKNPMAQVPVLELPDGTCLVQSVAILEWLEETHPTPPLLPTSPRDRAHVRALVEVINSGIQPLQNMATLKQVRAYAGADDKAWSKLFLDRGLQALQDLARPRAGRYLCGDDVTLADCFLVPQLYGARRFGADLAAIPLLLDVEARLKELQAVQEADVSRQPDAQPEG
ncbi:MAG: maleylacetoacetate isomerase [Deltaproteobacteria bacterium]|nr:maleylacetoacetate isomerase [Deltaproteobacteria bacterium]